MIRNIRKLLLKTNEINIERVDEFSLLGLTLFRLIKFNRKNTQIKSQVIATKQ